MNLKYPFYLCLIFIVFFGCKNQTGIEKNNKTAIPVKTVLAKEHDLIEYLTFNGVTKFQKKENIRSNVTGYISRMPFIIGDKINIGQAFALVRTKEQDALNEAIKIDSSLSKFSSPIRINSNSTGIITVLNIQKNNYIAEGDILATVAQPESLVIQLNVPYGYKNYIKIGTISTIILRNDKSITAKITAIMPIIDAVSQSQTYIIALPNMNLPENLNVLVKIIYKKAKKTLSIPHEALQTNELLTDFWVMKVVNDTLAIKEKVTPLLKNDTLVQIKSEAVKLNDLIVTEGSYQMQDSTLITIQKNN